jgi:GT2 family glycosyltransferase/CelD/BcsL family acetyltransferase involved in cellulose biosynthesis
VVEAPELDVIVVNFHSTSLIGGTVAVAREFCGEATRIILVDNSPGDGAADVVRAAARNATVITNPVNLGYAAAVNRALSVAEAEIVLLLNPDVRGISGRREDVLDAFGEPCVAAVVTRLVDAEGRLARNCFNAPRPFDLVAEDLALTGRFPRWRRPRRYRMLDWDYRSRRQVDAATGACLFLRRSAFDDVGGFDERFFVYYEETDWLVRAGQRGWRTVFVPTVEAVHVSGSSSPDGRAQPSLLLLESQHRYADKHFGRATGAVLRGTLLGLDAARAARHAVGGNERKAGAARDRIRVHITGRAPRPPAPSGATVEYVTSLEAVPRADWDRLAENAGHVFATPEWLGTWWRWYGRDRPALIGLVRRDSQLIAILPLTVWWRRRIPVLRFIGHGPSDRLGPICGPLTDPATAGAVATGFASIPLRRFVLVAELVPADQGFGRLVEGRALYTDDSPMLRLETDSWDDFVRARGRNFRYQVGRYPRKLAELGAVSYRLASDPGALDRDLDILFDLHRRRWEGAETPFLRAAAFHREVAARAMERGWLRLWFLELDGRAVAALYGFRFNGVESLYQGGRDPALAAYSLGFIVTAHAVEHAMADGVREYDMLRGGEQYKARFSNRSHSLETIGAARGAEARLLLAAVSAARGHSLGLRRHIVDRTPAVRPPSQASASAAPAADARGRDCR